MRTFKRIWNLGGCYFFTVNLASRENNNLLIDNIDCLREALLHVKAEHPFQIDAMVVLPEHLHCIWTLPPGDDRFDTRWYLIKSRFSRHIAKGERISPSRMRKGERGIWQRRYWEHAIRNEEDWHRHADYIHHNPVKHGYVKQAAEWEYSTFRRFVKRGMYTKDWTSEMTEENLE
jgi:putative transposase